jgi:DNA-binding beta-propeller fold protein YncE
VTNTDAGTVTEFDPGTLASDGEVKLGNEPRGIASGFGDVWVMEGTTGDVARIDPNSGKVFEVTVPSSGGDGVAAGLGGVWAANGDTSEVSRIDPSPPR